MIILAVLLVVTSIWVVLASVIDGRGRVGEIDASDAWMVEQHEHVVRLGQEASIPAGHPIARLELGDRERQA
jgi:hypothetical protein